jgi:uncharacterized protein (TIGR03000 family)
MTRIALSLSFMALLLFGPQVNAQPSFPQGNGSVGGSTSWEYGSSRGFSRRAYVPQSYETQYYFTPPAYRTYESAYYGRQPEYVVPGDAALIKLRVPANAEVWFSGDKTTSTGSDRSFVTPSLERGRRFAYDIRVRWMQNGKPMEKVEKIPVHPGDRLNLRIE